MDLLNGQRFSVASYGIAAAYAGWLLRQFGAEVMHVSALDREGMGAFLGEGAAFTSNPALKAAPGTTLITDLPLSVGARSDLEELARAGRVIWLTPWGLDNAWSERPASDLVLHAAGGWLASVGEPDREPLGPPGALGQFAAGLFAAIAAIAPGAPQNGLTEVSIAEAVAATMIYDSVAFQYQGVLRGRVGNRFARTQPTLVTLPAADGHIGLHAALHGQWLTLCKLIGRPELATDERFASLLERIAHIPELDAYLSEWTSARTRFEAFHQLQANRIPGSAHPGMAEVLASPQLKARGYWRGVSTPAGRQLSVPGAPARVLASAGPTEAPIRSGNIPWRAGALRVADLSMGWAGPMTGALLASFGADVIKVESHTHFDWWRGSRPPGDDLSLALWERSHVFNGVNRGKRGITLNLHTRRGNELARELIGTADVVIENFGAGVLEKLGLTYETLSAANPRLIMLRQPGFGSTGPEASYLAFGNTIEGMSGLTGLMGYEDGPPTMMSNAFGDPVSGLNGTLAVCAALRARERDGRGRLVECAQLEGFIPLVSESLIAYQLSGNLPARQGNYRPGHTPSGVFPCDGDDEWLALEVENDGQWASLSQAIGEPWATTAEFAAEAGRGANRRDLDAKLAAWTGARGRDESLGVLVAAGVPASPVHNEAELLFSEPFADSGFWESVDRAHVGTHLYPGLPIVTDGVRPGAALPAPLLGQHNVEVLTAMGLSESEIAELRAENVIGEVPRGYG